MAKWVQFFLSQSSFSKDTFYNKVINHSKKLYLQNAKNTKQSDEGNRRKQKKLYFIIVAKFFERDFNLVDYWFSVGYLVWFIVC